MSLSSVSCTRCGSNEMTEIDGFMQCSYCQSRFEISPRKGVAPDTSIGLASDIEVLLRKCEDDPANRQRYVQMILNIDPLNREVQRFVSTGRSNKKNRNPVSRKTDVSGIPAGNRSTKSWLVAYLLSIFFGIFGLDRFYLGQFGLGIAKFLTLGGFGVWWLTDAILFALKKVKDSSGRLVA